MVVRRSRERSLSCAAEFVPVYARWPNLHWPQPHVPKKEQVTALGNMNIILEQCSALLGDASKLLIFLKISVIMTLSLGPPPPLSVIAKVADSHTWT